MKSTEGFVNVGVFGNVSFTIPKNMLRQLLLRARKNSMSSCELLYGIVLHDFSKIVIFAFY